MKWMKKLRMINWHYFTDETMDFGKQTLITGQNGAGKSTIIDALQVLFIADQRQIRFNPAAHDEAKRTLINYLKGKIGSDDRSFVREGDFSSYIMAEFRDDEKKESFVIGVVIDVYRGDSGYKEEYFILHNCKIDDLDLVKPSGQLRNRDEFRKWVQPLTSLSVRGGKGMQAVFEHNKSEYQKALLSRLGQLHERFFSIFTKALSFKPIQNIRDFVYEYILDRRELQLELMKQNFEIHEKYQAELQELQIRKGKLEEIRAAFGRYSRLKDTVAEQDYVIRRLQLMQQYEVLDQIRRELEKTQASLSRSEQELKLAEHKRETARRLSEEKYGEWQNHAAERKRRELQERITALKADAHKLRQELHMLVGRFRLELQTVTELLYAAPVESLAMTGEERQALEVAEALLATILSRLEREESLSGEEEEFRQRLEEAGQLLGTLYERLIKAVSRTEDQLEEMKVRVAELEQAIRDLEQKRKRRYSDTLVKLKQLLEEELCNRSRVRIFCEEMDITDESWRDAVEGFLNTQRFDLLVEPEVFTEALKLYEREKWTYKLEGIGLVDTEKEASFLGRSERGSLAETVQSDDPVIRAHADHLLGKVMMADNEQQLRNHRTAITPSCMVYNNLVARQIPRKQYEMPYIGAKAVERQLELTRKELEQLSDSSARLQGLMGTLLGWVGKLSEKKSGYRFLADLLDAPERLRQSRFALDSSEEELQRIDVSETDRLKADYEAWKEDEANWYKRTIELSRETARLEAEIKQDTGQIYVQQQKASEAELFLSEWLSEFAGTAVEEGASDRWVDVERQDLLTARKIENWVNNRKGNMTRMLQEFGDLEKLRLEYNLVYSFNGEASLDKNNKYEALLHDIEHLNIPEYQEKVSLALKESEEEFKSHFIFKLREAIQMAKREFHELNYALKNFPFSEDKYHFEVSASDKYRKFYDAVMDPSIMEQGSLFDISEEDKLQVLQELFELLVRGQAGDLEEFTDYRRYLDFDIIVTTQDTRYKFSQVLKEKSGGETQTPFYISILASFHHLYSGNRSARLVIFDEAFNKMDEQRIQTSLRLIKQMNLQLIAAVPDEKMQHMAPEVTTTLIVSKDHYRCFVDMIAQAEASESMNAASSGAGTEPESEEELSQETLF